ncbi:MAG: hypothetical protein ACI9JT_000889 [Polaribacter sp.]|jgi:hypothetical protein
MFDVFTSFSSKKVYIRNRFRIKNTEHQCKRNQTNLRLFIVCGLKISYSTILTTHFMKVIILY